MKRNLKLPIFLFLLLTLGMTPGTHAEPKQVTLHGAYGLSGYGSTFGTLEQQATILAIEEANQSSGEKFNFALKVEDTQSTNTGTLNAVRKLISWDKAKVILGATWIDSYQAVLPVIDKQGIMIMSGSAALEVFKKTPNQYPLVFSTYYGLTSQARFLMKHLQESNLRKIALLLDQDPYFETFRNIINREKSNYNLDITLSESINVGDKDFRSTLLKVRELNPDGVIFGFGDESSLFAFLKQRLELAPKLKLFGTEYLDGYLAEHTNLLEGVVFPSTTIANQEFAAKFRKRFGVSATLCAGPAYDAANIIISAYSEGIETPQNIRNYLLSKEFDTVTYGKIRFLPSGGVDAIGFKIKKVKDGKVVE